jgi:hypothetical protein
MVESSVEAKCHLQVTKSSPHHHLHLDQIPHPEQQNSLVSEPFAGPDTNYRQTILLPDEDLRIRFTGYVTAVFKSVLWFLGCILTR